MELDNLVSKEMRVNETPNLKGRTARCTYYGQKPGNRNECDKCEKNNLCRCEEPSNKTLPFFQYHPDKKYDEYYCGCAFGWD